MSAKSSKLLHTAIVLSLLTVPVSSGSASAIDVRINQVTSTVSNGDGGISAGLFGTIFGQVMKGLQDKENAERRNSRPITPA